MFVCRGQPHIRLPGGYPGVEEIQPLLLTFFDAKPGLVGQQRFRQWQIHLFRVFQHQEFRLWHGRQPGVNLTIQDSLLRLLCSIKCLDGALVEQARRQLVARCLGNHRDGYGFLIQFFQSFDVPYWSPARYPNQRRA